MGSHASPLFQPAVRVLEEVSSSEESFALPPRVESEEDDEPLFQFVGTPPSMDDDGVELEASRTLIDTSQHDQAPPVPLEPEVLVVPLSSQSPKKLVLLRRSPAGKRKSRRETVRVVLRRTRLRMCCILCFWPYRTSTNVWMVLRRVSRSFEISLLLLGVPF